MKKMFFALFILFSACKKDNPPVPTPTIHSVVMKFHSDDSTMILRNYTYPVSGNLVNKQDTVYQVNTTITYNWPKNTTTMSDHSMHINDLHIPLTTFQVSCELWIDGIKVANDGPHIGSSGCEYYIY